MGQHILGIDIAKESFDAALLGKQQTCQGHFENSGVGFAKLDRWLTKRKATNVFACMEASGRYWEALALHLADAGHQVSVVNPKVVKKHSEVLMQRNKTDQQDALTIADYCLKHQPALWTPPSAAYRELQALVRHVQALKTDRTREINRKESGISSPQVLATIEAHIAFLDAQIEQLEEDINKHIDQNPDLKRNKELLTSIPGIGDITAASFMAEVPDIRRFNHAQELAAFAGLTPGQRHSGSSLHSSGKLVKWGNKHLRAAFYMPALSAHKWNPIAAALRQRLLDRGKSKMTVVVAIMRKLIHLCYGVLKTRTPFDPNHGQNSPIVA